MALSGVSGGGEVSRPDTRAPDVKEHMTTLVKICGITNLADARYAVEAGADFLGFVFAPESKRVVTPATVHEITRQLPAGIRTVGVFVNVTAEQVAEILAFCKLDLAQLHGEEPPAVATAIGIERVWKTVTLRTPQDVELALTLPAAAVLADTATSGARGGTGLVGDWTLAARLAGRRSVVLAGGLKPENVAAAIGAVRPFAVDVSSGVEFAPGRKDHDKVRRFIAAVRAVNSQQ